MVTQNPEIFFSRVLSLPAQCVANTVYFVQAEEGSPLSIYVAGNDGVGVLTASVDSATPRLPSVGSLSSNGGIDRGNDISLLASTSSVIYFTPGPYVLNTQPNVYGNGLLGIGAQFSGNAGVPGATDRTALLSSPFFMSKLMVSAGTAAASSANENVFYVSGYLNPTAAQAGYQKNVKYTTLIHADPSSYSSPGNGITSAVLTVGKDGVGDDVQVSLAPGNMTGRIFARDSITSYPAGSDGSGCVQELKSVNSSSSQPFYASSTSKHVLNLFADGAGYHTSGLWLDIAQGGVGGYYDAIMVTGQSVVNNLLMYRQTVASNAPVIVQITKAGQARFASGVGRGDVSTDTSALGAIVGKLPVYDMNGNSLGVTPVYAH